MKKVLGLSVVLAVAQVAHAADIEAGKEMAATVCAACHGANGVSVSDAIPNLAAQRPAYIEAQLKAFKEGTRKHSSATGHTDIMNVIQLSAQDMANVAAYFASQQEKPGASRNKDTIDLGRRIWRAGDASKGLPACASCHGATGAGMPVEFPRLAGQHAEYLEAQLKAFAAGTRANDANKAMRTIAAKMTGQEMRAVADYAAGLR